MTDRPEHVLEDVLDDAIAASHGDKVCLGDMLSEFGNRSFGPILILLSVVIISPVGGIPGLPILLGAIIILLAGQMMVGREHPWLPARLQKTGFDRSKAEAWRDEWHGWLARIDEFIQSRFEWAAGAWSQWLAAICLIFLSATMIPLELIPFAATVPAVAILCFGIGITARDGLMMLLGFAVTLPSIWLTVAWWPWTGG